MSYKLPLFAAAAFLGGYMLISNRQLRVNEYELKVSKLPENFVGKKILLLADLHSFPNNIDSPIRYHCKMPRYGRDTKYLYVYLKPAAASAALPGSSSLSNTQSTIVCNRFLMFISDG